MSGYFDRENIERNRALYPNLAALDQNVTTLLSSKTAQGWDTARKEYEICRIHPVYWMEKYGYILAGELTGGAEEVGEIQFRLNNVQLQVANRICQAFVSKPWKRVQAIVLKHRKAGISTLIAAFDYWCARFTRNLNGFVIADLGGHTDNIIAMISRFHKHDTCGETLEAACCPPQKRPMPGGKNKKGLSFSNGSIMEQDSGENSNPGTSGTIQLLHMSENAKWRDPSSAETSLLNSVPRTGFAFIVKESTAFGINKFAVDCEDAEKGKTNWEFLFVRWPDLPDCEQPMELGEEITYIDREKELIAAYKLRPGHIKFRRSQIDLLGSEEMFQQDFPLNSKEPFLVSGASFFNTAMIQDRIQEIKFFRDYRSQGWPFVEKTYPEIIVRLKANPQGLRTALNFIEDRNVVPQIRGVTMNKGQVTLLPPSKAAPEHLVIFRFPVPESRYLVIIDVAEGKQNDEYTSDNSIIEVQDTWRKEQVLEWGGLFDEEVTALYAVMIATLYNNAEIVAEMNNKCGGLLKAELEKTGYRNFFYRQPIVGQQVRREFGWETTVGNKKEVCGQLKLDFKNGGCLLHSIALLEEMLNFIDINGKLEASLGTDDRVMATSIGVNIISTTISYRNQRKKTLVHGGVNMEPIPKNSQRNDQHKQAEVLRRYM